MPVSAKVPDAPKPKPTIEAVALCLGGAIHSLPRPARHHDLIRAMISEGISRDDVAIAEQGFVTNEGNFLSRWRARRVAEKAGQCETGTDGDRELCSEDVW
jgi:hypothetical protein